MRSRRSHEDGENAAWPGLVDLFAFGMVIMLVMWLAATNVGPSAPPTPGGGTNDPLLAKGRELATQLRGELQKSLLPTDLQEKPDLPGVELRSYHRKEVYFDTKKYELADNDREAITNLGKVVADAIESRPAVFVQVNGTADPRPFFQQVPPRDNVELSALRAAEVSKILIGAGLKNRLNVVGLGETGTLVAGATDDH